MLRSKIFTDAERIARNVQERVRDGLATVRSSGSGRATAPAPFSAGPIYDADNDVVISTCLTEVDMTDSGALTAPSPSLP